HLPHQHRRHHGGRNPRLRRGRQGGCFPGAGARLRLPRPPPPPHLSTSLDMIDLYTWSTPNGRKISICLEELELPYRVIEIDIGKGEQYGEEFSRASPNHKIPAIVDTDTGFSLMESGAILMYLSEKTGALTPSDPEERYRMLEWLMWQMGGLGPMLGQAHHFLKNNPGKSAYGEQRYHREAARLYAVLDARLA